MSSNQTLTRDQGSWTPTKTILWSSAVVVVTDGIAGILYFLLLLKMGPALFMQWIASAINGPTAFAAGTSTIVEGFIIHVIVTIIMGAVYYYAYKKSSLIRRNTIASGIIYGLGIWLVMNLLVFPLSNVPPAPFVLFNAIVSIIWHIVLVGVPFAVITNTHSKNSINTYNN